MSWIACKSLTRQISAGWGTAQKAKFPLWSSHCREFLQLGPHWTWEASNFCTSPLPLVQSGRIFCHRKSCRLIWCTRTEWLWGKTQFFLFLHNTKNQQRKLTLRRFFHGTQVLLADLTAGGKGFWCSSWVGRLGRRTFYLHRRYYPWRDYT